MNDKKMFRWLGLLIILPIALAIFGGDRFRYPCQDPSNWDKPICQKPACDVTRTCPEHVFKGQRDPRLGPLDDKQNQSVVPQSFTPAPATQGVNCGK
jgi:hypothetical protein